MARLRTLSEGARRLDAGARYLERTSAQVSRERDAARPDRAQYKTADWRRLRWSVLVRDDFTCRMCGWQHPLSRDSAALKSIGRADLVQGKAPGLVADHIRPHRGSATLFWDAGNLQCLCKACHDGAKQRSERRAVRGMGG